MQKEVRIFVSSTFVDLHEERDYIVKRTFQRLEVYCRKRGISFTGVDLRWGITEASSKEGKTIRLCLDEIHRCEPFFVNIIGERYGWIPTKEELSKDKELVKNYKKIIETAVEESLSITEMEIREGVLDKNGRINAYFFLCDRDIYRQKNISKGIPVESEVNRGKLGALRDRILDSGYPVFEGFDSKEQLGNLIYDNIKDAIDEKYPLNSDLTIMEKVQVVQNAYSHSRSDIYVQNEKLNTKLIKWISEGHERLIITGESGMGKSAFVANVFDNEEKWRELGLDNKCHVYYIGASSDELVELYRFYLYRFGKFDTIKTGFEYNLLYLRQTFIECLNSLEEEVYIIMDAYDQLSDDDDMTWIYEVVNPKIRFIITTTVNADKIDHEKWQYFIINSMDEVDIKNIINKVLEVKGKSLDEELMNLLMENVYYNKQTSVLKKGHLENTYGLYAGRLGNPMYLRVFLEELIQGSTYENLKETILKYREANNVKALLEMKFKRLEEEFNVEVVQFVLGHIYLSKNGLSEQELRLLAFDHDIPYLNILECLNNIMIHLISDGEKLGFYHSYIRRVVEERYLGNQDIVDSYRRNIVITFYEFENIEIKNQEIPYQLNQLKDYKGIIRFFHDKGCFQDMCSQQARELHHYILNGLETNVSILDGIYENFRQDQEIMKSLYRFGKVIKEDYILENILNRLIDIGNEDDMEKLSWHDELVDLYLRTKRIDLAEEHVRKSIEIIYNNEELNPIVLTYMYIRYALLFEIGEHYSRGLVLIEEICESRMDNSIDHLLQLWAEQVTNRIKYKQNEIDKDEYEKTLLMLLDKINKHYSGYQYDADNHIFAFNITVFWESILLELARFYSRLKSVEESDYYYDQCRQSYINNRGAINLDMADLLLEIGNYKSGWLMKAAILGDQHKETVNAFELFRKDYKKYKPELYDSLNSDLIYERFVNHIEKHKHIPDYKTLDETIKVDWLMKTLNFVKKYPFVSDIVLIIMLMCSGLLARGFILKHSNWVIIPLLVFLGGCKGFVGQSRTLLSMGIGIFAPNILLALTFVPNIISHSIVMIWSYRYNMDAIVAAWSIPGVEELSLTEFLMNDIHIFRISLIRWCIFAISFGFIRLISQTTIREDELVRELMIEKRGDVLEEI